MLATMTDSEALERLHATICKLLSAGPRRNRWLDRLRTGIRRAQYCMDSPRRAWVRSHAMPLLELSDAELSTAATACRAMAYQEGERAKAMSNPDMRRPIENAARRFAQLAARLETARSPSSATGPTAPRPQRRS
jgi:hypothetical protein